jgi:hypothetical protein
MSGTCKAKSKVEMRRNPLVIYVEFASSKCQRVAATDTDNTLTVDNRWRKPVLNP